MVGRLLARARQGRPRRGTTAAEVLLNLVQEERRARPRTPRARRAADLRSCIGLVAAVSRAKDWPRCIAASSRRFARFRLRIHQCGPKTADETLFLLATFRHATKLLGTPYYTHSASPQHTPSAMAKRGPRLSILLFISAGPARPPRALLMNLLVRHSLLMNI